MRYGKAFLRIVFVTLLIPLAITCWCERACGSTKDVCFQTWAQCLSLIPGIAGCYARRAFYWWTIDACSLDCRLSFGMIISNRRARIEDGAYVGCYAVIGAAELGTRCLIGTRASIINGPDLHVMQTDGTWSGPQWDRIELVRIGADAWVGEGAIAMASVGTGAMVAAGAVVSQPVPARVVVAGNPARFVRKMDPQPDPSPEPIYETQTNAVR